MSATTSRGPSARQAALATAAVALAAAAGASPARAGSLDPDSLRVKVNGRLWKTIPNTTVSGYPTVPSAGIRLTLRRARGGDLEQLYSGVAAADLLTGAGLDVGSVSELDVERPAGDAAPPVVISGDEVRDGFLGDPAATGRQLFATFDPFQGVNEINFMRPSRGAGDDNGDDAIFTPGGQDLTIDVKYEATPLDVTVTPATATATAGGAVTLTAQTAPTAGTVTYGWDFDDGTTAAGPSATHSWQRPGQYLVTVTAVTSQGAAGTGQATVTVPAPGGAKDPGGGGGGGGGKAATGGGSGGKGAPTHGTGAQGGTAAGGRAGKTVGHDVSGTPRRRTAAAATPSHGTLHRTAARPKSTPHAPAPAAAPRRPTAAPSSHRAAPRQPASGAGRDAADRAASPGATATATTHVSGLLLAGTGSSSADVARMLAGADGRAAARSATTHSDPLRVPRAAIAPVLALALLVAGGAHEAGVRLRLRRSPQDVA